ncbi:hypothetical protein [Pantoea sp. CFSAN033090]|uniref:hypothetical protein n=1 Tax=Pantoea sp. CFSAN033090 TaxID=1690502 RepID=UPI00068F6F1E|nr:hypothetical protein [Pantoea sp. CFSAN033090]KOA68687.1 hypothetical protein AFL22_19760 [Pantoea sp. CFSAN033090]
MKTDTSREYKAYDKYKPGKATKLLLILVILIVFAIFWLFQKKINYLLTDNWSYISVGKLEKIEEHKSYFGNTSVIYTQKGDKITVDGTYQDYHKFLNANEILVVLKRPESDKGVPADGNNLWCISNECHFQADGSTTFFRLNKD